LALADINNYQISEIICAGVGYHNFGNGHIFAGRCFESVKRLGTMKTPMLIIVLCVLAALGGYLYGRSCVKAEITEKKVEVVKYVARKRAKIQARPNSTRDELLERMRQGLL
jgi:hypothetical protein